MGKSKKRSRERHEKIEELLSKVQRLEEKLAKSTDKENKMSNDQALKDPDSEVPIVSEVETGQEQKDDEKTDSLETESQETEQDQEWLKFLGDDPTSSQAIKLQINSDLLRRWEFFCKEGMKKEDVESLLQTYACAVELETPKLNPQIAATMKDFAITRDNHMNEVQKMAGTALSIQGSVVSGIYEESEEFDLERLLTLLRDAGKLLIAIIHKQSNTRKAFIEPGLTKETEAVLKEAKTDEFLYGKELSEKIKEAKVLNKVSESLKQPAAKKNNSPNQQSNFRIPFARRPMGGQTGFTSFAGRLKQRVFVRNKQQFVNHRAQVNQPPRFPNKADKKN